MKLYTELEVRKALDLYRSPIRPLAEQVINSLTPIKLPSDEEIDNIDWGSQVHVYHVEGFTAGAKWMKEQILNQNK